MTEILSVQGLSKRFGGLLAVSDVSFAVQKGEIFGIIGPNGAGKTTLFNVIAGYYKPSAGKIAFEGTDISGLPSDQIARRGVARTFQAVYNYSRHTVAENLRRSEVIARRHGPLAYFANRNVAAAVDSGRVAEFIGLSSIMGSVAGSLAYGQQKVLGIGMAMMRWAIDYCRNQGCYKLALSSNLKRGRTHAFYESLGFERHGYSFRMDLQPTLCWLDMAPPITAVCASTQADDYDVPPQ